MSEPDSERRFQQALRLNRRGKAKAAFLVLKDAAARGDAGAQHMLGYFYGTGRGTRKNINKALHWYKQSWRSGRQTFTLINIGLLYKNIGDFSKAKRWLKKAATMGDGDASYELAKLYLSSGRRSEKKKAIVWLKRTIKSKYVTVNSTEKARKDLVRLNQRGAK